MRVRISEELRPKLRVGVLRLEGIEAPRDGGDALWNEILARCAELAARYGGTSIGDIPGVQESRRLYRSIGLDPTKTRPSSEALLRRAVKERGLYRIHPLVDLVNLVSLEELLSVGLYNEARIDGDVVTVRIGADGWRFEGIRRGEIHVGGRLCVADASGPFGSPTADSRRTSIEGEVARALAVFFQPLDGSAAALGAALERAEALAAVHLGARTAAKEIVEGRAAGAC
ncbi:MAG: phenylalanine--tRNA ligase beta subunit-related protein [Proteobacteria bacterium]|nr:phenylalanine--tRNA ligase beta subunit-related protein [Pseudomonadota bacterium]